MVERRWRVCLAISIAIHGLALFFSPTVFPPGSPAAEFPAVIVEWIDTGHQTRSTNEQRKANSLLSTVERDTDKEPGYPVLDERGEAFPATRPVPSPQQAPVRNVSESTSPPPEITDVERLYAPIDLPPADALPRPEGRRVVPIDSRPEPIARRSATVYPSPSRALDQHGFPHHITVAADFLGPAIPSAFLQTPTRETIGEPPSYLDHDPVIVRPTGHAAAVEGIHSAHRDLPIDGADSSKQNIRAEHAFEVPVGIEISSATAQLPNDTRTLDPRAVAAPLKPAAPAPATASSVQVPAPVALTGEFPSDRTPLKSSLEGPSSAPPWPNPPIGDPPVLEPVPRVSLPSELTRDHPRSPDLSLDVGSLQSGMSAEIHSIDARVEAADPGVSSTQPRLASAHSGEARVLEWVPETTHVNPGPGAPAILFSHYVPPPYPFTLRRRGIEGSIEVEVTIDTGGSVTGWTIVNREGPPAFAAAVEQVIGQWRFAVPPSWREGRGNLPPLRVRIDFKLQ